LEASGRIIRIIGDGTSNQYDFLFDRANHFQTTEKERRSSRQRKRPPNGGSGVKEKVDEGVSSAPSEHRIVQPRTAVTEAPNGGSQDPCIAVHPNSILNCRQNKRENNGGSAGEPSTSVVVGGECSYPFEDGVIRLPAKELEKLVSAFTSINVVGELRGMSKWAASKGSNWYPACKALLAKKDREARLARDIANMKAKTGGAEGPRKLRRTMI
jgi:hypothetical protein